MYSQHNTFRPAKRWAVCWAVWCAEFVSQWATVEQSIRHSYGGAEWLSQFCSIQASHGSAEQATHC